MWPPLLTLITVISDPEHIAQWQRTSKHQEPVLLPAVSPESGAKTVSVSNIGQQHVTGPQVRCAPRTAPEHLHELEPRVCFAQSLLIFTDIWIQDSEPRTSAES